MTTLWIVHRDADRRGVLARLAGAGEDTILGDPSDRLFEASPPADVVLLGLAGDFESELEFAHRFAPRLPAARWVLVAERTDVADAQSLFDTLQAPVLPYPPTPDALRPLLRRVPARRSADTLSDRRRRDAVAARFARWLSGLELPEVLRALDPRLRRTPILVRGEPGTGRALLAHYVHAFGGGLGGTIAVTTCAAGMETPDVLETLVRAGRQERARRSITLLLEDVDRLAPRVQRELAGWLELSPPPGPPHSAWVRFIATAGDPDDPSGPRLEESLLQPLSALPIRLPPLRESPERIVAAVEDVAQAFADLTDGRRRRFSPEALEALRRHPWPGNVRELEAVVVRTLAGESSDPVRVSSLRFDPTPRVSPTSLRTPPEPAREPEPWAAPFVPGPAATGPGPEAPASGTSPEEDTWRLMADEPAVEAVPEPGIDIDLFAPGAPGRAAPAEPAFELPPDPDPAPASDPAPAPAPSSAPPPEPEPGPGGPLALGGVPEREPAPTPDAHRPRPGADPARRSPADLVGDSALRRFLAALSHELGNSVVPLRTAAALLPERFADPDFRARFGEIVRTDSRRIESVLERLARFVAFGAPARAPLGLRAILDEILEAERPALQERSVLVTQELEPRHGEVLGDAQQLAFALGGLLRKTLERIRPRGHLYLASRHHPRGLRGDPSLRLLLRFETQGRVATGASDDGSSLSETALDLLLTEAIVRAHDGRFALDQADAAETVVLLDLPAPAAETEDEETTGAQ